MISNSSLRTPLARVRGLGSAKSGTGHFWLQRLTAVANLVLAIAFIAVVISLSGRTYPEALSLLGHPGAHLLEGATPAGLLRLARAAGLVASAEPEPADRKPAGPRAPEDP